MKKILAYSILTIWIILIILLFSFYIYHFGLLPFVMIIAGIFAVLFFFAAALAIDHLTDLKK